MELILIILGCIPLSCGWAYLWAKTFKTKSFKGFTLHTLLFSALSIGVVVGVYFIFRSVLLRPDGTVGGSPVWILYLIFVAVFFLGCVLGIVQTLGDIIPTAEQREEALKKNNKE